MHNRNNIIWQVSNEQYIERHCAEQRAWFPLGQLFQTNMCAYVALEGEGSCFQSIFDRITHVPAHNQ